MFKKKVEQLSLLEYNLRTKIYLGLMLALSLVSLGFGAFEFLSFAPVQFAILVVTIMIAVISGQHQPRLAKFKTAVSAREIITFWNVIWLGVGGGLVAVAACEIAASKFNGKNKGRGLAMIFGSVISTFVAGKVFYLFLSNFGGYNHFHVSMHEIGIGWVIAATFLMAVVHFGLQTIAHSIYLSLESEYPILAGFKESLRKFFANNLLGLTGGLLFHFTFLSFGTLFGLFLLPLVLVAHFSHRIHFRQLEQKTKQITESSRVHLATVEALATAIDARDQVGVGHVRRTQIYAVGIGELLGLSPDEIQALRTGALLHDIGKLGVPDHILNKPGRLTPAEMEKMKIHPSVGASILEKIKFEYPVVPTIKYHHESWDGTGYPEGLKKEQIPLTARILAVGDAYDTLRGARPYRAAVSRDEARRFLMNGAGTQFDPKIVDVFLRNLRQFEIDINAAELAYESDSELLESIVSGDSNTGRLDQGYVEQIKRANHEVFTLYELAKVFSASLNLQDTLSLFVKKVGELMPFDTCAVYLLNKTGEAAIINHVKGENSDALIGKKIKIGDGATGYVLKKRQAVYNINPALDLSIHKLDFDREYTAMASLPLITNEKLIGAISLYSCDLEIYQDEHMRLLETVSRIASDAISKSLYHAETETHALTDPMTNLPNARSLQMHFENEAARAKRTETPLQLIMLDLDGFKKVNDTFGHKIGDLLLKEVSKVMREQLREYDFLARYAGDEFVAIVPDTTDEAVRELCQRMEKAVLEFDLPVGDGRFAKVGVSIGAACYPYNGETLDQVIIAADHAMYSVKASHKQVKPSVPPPEEKPASEQSILVGEEAFVVELDESHIISTAIN